MDIAKKTDRIIIIVLIALAVGILGWVFFGSKHSHKNVSKSIAATDTSTYEDFDGTRAGVLTGSFHDTLVEEFLPNSKIYNFDTYTDLIEALKSNKIDYFLVMGESAESISSENPELTTLKDSLKQLEIGAMFPKTDTGAHLRDQMNEFIGKIRSDGTLDKVENFWKSDPSAESTPVDTSGLSGENGTLRFATTGTKVPTSFQVGDQIAGADPDIAVRFCKEYGYGIDVSTVNFSGIIPGITTGVYDFAMSDTVITDERKESVYFSDPYRLSDMYVMARKADASQAQQDDEGLFASIVSSFKKNFIRENRWKLILEGTKTTCIITVAAVLLGTLLAFGICMFRRTGSHLANRISNLYVSLLQGTPMVVLLMILYYVIFGSSGLDAVVVAIIGFTLNFGAYASEIMRTAIESVPKGQREAALALGYSERQTFFDFIFPQAAVQFLPVLLGEMISLLKSTSIVGYIAIQDLTKMSDIIRSRTYEAFFPLIVTALIYFALAWVIRVAMKRLLAHVDPRAKKGKKKEVSAQ